MRKSAQLSVRSCESLKAQYEAALREKQIVVFVRDNGARRLVFFSLDNQQALR